MPNPDQNSYVVGSGINYPDWLSGLITANRVVTSHIGMMDTWKVPFNIAYIHALKNIAIARVGDTIVYDHSYDEVFVSKGKQIRGHYLQFTKLSLYKVLKMLHYLENDILYDVRFQKYSIPVGSFVLHENDVLLKDATGKFSKTTMTDLKNSNNRLEYIEYE